MTDFFADNFSNCVILAVLIMAMIPMLESRVAIPFALSTAIWGEGILSPITAFFVALLGGMLPSILIILFSRWVKNRTSGFVCEKFMKRYEKQIQKLKAKNTTFKKCMMLSTFVAVPLPLTGVWTGSLIAGMTNLKIWQGFLSILIGEALSCSVVIAICLLFENSAFFIFMFSLILIGIFVLMNLVVWLIGKIRSRKKEIEIKCL